MPRSRHRTLLFCLGAAALTACTTGVDMGGSGGGSATGGTGSASGSSSSSSSSGAAAPTITHTDKVDILLAIDNSRSMADKQQVLADALGDLVTSLVNPPCVDAQGNPAAAQPANGIDACPAGTSRSQLPITDIHVGVVDSSLGGHGSDACPATETQTCSGASNTSNDDHGHLVDRTAACGGSVVPTYQNIGYVAWDPAQKMNPPGEADQAAFTNHVRSLVLGVDQVGCGYESQLEGWYRFLVDPAPYASIVIQNGEAVTMGTDQAVLTQRASFLRPDSLLAILMLSDENDCSLKTGGQFYYAAQQRAPGNANEAFHLPRARQECAINPNDPCCLSCGQKAPNCPDDPTCASSPKLTDLEDNINLRCYDTKRRFGIEFLNPTDRYVKALSSPTIANAAGDLVQNPIFAPGPGGLARDKSLVLFAAIVGVPWQDLARSPGDLTQGYKSSDEMLAKDAGGKSTWDLVLGDPANGVAPLDPHMRETMQPRSGADPVNGVQIAPANAANGADAINGHEYSIPANDDLQYACIFPLAQPRDCAANQVSCDCQDPMNDNPLCAPDPSHNNQRTLQVSAKGYPGVRHLQVVQGLGAQGVAASICPSELKNEGALDYAYRPVVRALLERAKGHLGGAN